MQVAKRLSRRAFEEGRVFDNCCFHCRPVIWSQCVFICGICAEENCCLFEDSLWQTLTSAVVTPTLLSYREYRYRCVIFVIFLLKNSQGGMKCQHNLVGFVYVS